MDADIVQKMTAGIVPVSNFSLFAMCLVEKPSTTATGLSNNQTIACLFVRQLGGRRRLFQGLARQHSLILNRDPGETSSCDLLTEATYEQHHWRNEPGRILINQFARCPFVRGAPRAVGRSLRGAAAHFQGHFPKWLA
ncbi:MAG TPA: hypothetical protein VFE51_15295 [Verrucomicrobiae bacterium]|nr:hypothetical protein [Verrucomicrobiae bacterium]